MKVKKLPIIIIIIAIILIIIALQFVYVVREDEQVVLIEFGSLIGSVNAGDSKEAGLHWKAPWVTANTYTKKILRWDGDPDLIPTRPDNQNIFIDTTARWRIKDPELFYRTLKGNIIAAAGRLDDSIDSAVRNVIRSSFFIQVVSSDANKINQVINDSVVIPREILAEAFKNKFESKLNSINAIQFFESLYNFQEGKEEKYLIKENLLIEEKKQIIEILKFVEFNIPMGSKMKGREQLEGEILNVIKDKILTDFGIEIIDVIIKRVDYSDENRQAAYERMIAERNKVATEKRSIGTRRMQEIDGEIEEFTSVEISKAKEEALTLIGEGDSEASRIYAETYTDSPEDIQKGLPSKEEFYEFYILLQAYENLSRKSDITLSTNSDFFRMLKDMNAQINK